MSKQRVLVIEDDAPIRRGIVDALAFYGYQTFEAADGDAGAQKALKVGCDLILLDLVLPRRDGLSILQDVRKARPTLPVIILTALGAEEDRVKGLRLGADDYVVKPFSVKELLARVDAVLRRSPERPSDVTHADIPGGKVDLARREVLFEDGTRVGLCERETDVLRYLIRNAGRAITRDELLSRVWRITPGRSTTRTIDMHVARLREKLRDNSESPRVLLTVRGKGYMFAGEADEES